jgi:hypothetical protein
MAVCSVNFNDHDKCYMIYGSENPLPNARHIHVSFLERRRMCVTYSFATGLDPILVNGKHMIFLTLDNSCL